MPELRFHTDPASSPLAEALRARLDDGGMTLVESTPYDAEWLLLEHETDTALVSPLVFARNQTELALMPGVAVAAVGPTADALLAFRGGLDRFERVAVPARDTMDAMLVEIILREKYGMDVRATIHPGSVDEALASHDAVLVLGHDAVERAGTYGTLDLVDEWFDMTQLPFVRLVVTGWTHRMDAVSNAMVAAAASTADSAAVADLRSRAGGRLSPDALHLIPGHYRYTFDEDAVEGLTQFFRYAFYLGLHRDIPTLSFWSPPDAQVDPAQTDTPADAPA